MTMSFLGNLLGVKAKDMRDGLIKAIVSFDPEGASAAQIEEYKDRVDELAAIAAKAEGQAQADEKRAADLKANFERYKKAAEHQLGVVDGLAEGSAERAKAQSTFDKLYEDAKGLKADWQAAEEAAKDSRAYADERKGAHGEAVEKLTKAKDRLAKAVRDQARAKQEAERAAERKRDMEKAAGLEHGLDTMDVALDAMSSNAAKDRQKAAAAKMTADALGASRAADDGVAAALAAADGAGAAAPASNKDRLADL